MCFVCVSVSLCIHEYTHPRFLVFSFSAVITVIAVIVIRFFFPGVMTMTAPGFVFLLLLSLLHYYHACHCFSLFLIVIIIIIIIIITLDNPGRF
jgi:hypothetical protein